MERNTTDETLISIGELAERFHISRRTLRLYDEMGIFCPEYTDRITAYRYYSSAQFPRLEMILQMKSFGIPLKQIRLILDQKNLTLYEALISRRVDELDREIAERRAARASLFKQLGSLRFLHRTPELENPFIEFIPKRRAYFFDIESYDFRDPAGSEIPWKRALQHIRDVFTEKNIPLTFMHQICCMIERENLVGDNFLCSRAFMLAEESGGPSGLSEDYLPSGIYACMYTRYDAMNGIAESRALELLLARIAGMECRIAGPYYGEVVVENSLFDYNSREILVKMQIPIEMAQMG